MSKDRANDAAILRQIAGRIRDGLAEGMPKSSPEAAPSTADDESHERSVIAQLAHELKSPIGAMTAAAEVMAAQRLGPLENSQYLNYAEDIAASGRHALAILDRVLEDWRQPVREDRLAFVELELNRIVQRTVSVLQSLARQRGQVILTQLQQGLPHLIADSTSVRQILFNLLTNATKYAHADSPITVSTSCALDGPIVLEVRDTGPGMSAAALTRLADAGTAADGPSLATTTNAATGTGLGLPLVRRLAAANGAEFALASTPGGPTVITLTFSKDKVVPV